MPKITGAHLERIAESVHPLDTDDMRAKYKARDIPRGHLVKDIDVRYRWDLFWAAGGSDILNRMVLDGVAGVKDAHVDTALRSIVPAL